MLDEQKCLRWKVVCQEDLVRIAFLGHDVEDVAERAERGMGKAMPIRWGVK